MQIFVICMDKGNSINDELNTLVELENYLSGTWPYRTAPPQHLNYKINMIYVMGIGQLNGISWLHDSFKF